MNYIALKHFHIACVTLSGSFFCVRGIWMLRDSTMLQQRWVKTIPHLVDTLLLASALAMVIVSGQYPFVQDWLTAKVGALVLYVVLGTVALRPDKTKTVRVQAFAAALATFGYIVSVAILKQALPFS